MKRSGSRGRVNGFTSVVSISGKYFREMVVHQLRSPYNDDLGIARQSRRKTSEIPPRPADDARQRCRRPRPPEGGALPSHAQSRIYTRRRLKRETAAADFGERQLTPS